MPDPTPLKWLLAILAAFGIGASKSGFAGISLVHVLAFIFLFGARDSTGVVLPMLIVGDLLAVIAFRQHARWEYIRRLLLPALTGIVIGWALMGRISDAAYKPVVGTIIGQRSRRSSTEPRQANDTPLDDVTCTSKQPVS